MAVDSGLIIVGLIPVVTFFILTKSFRSIFSYTIFLILCSYFLFYFKSMIDAIFQVYLFLVVTLLFYVKYEWCDLLFKNNTENPECRRHYSKDTFFVAGSFFETIFFHSPSLYMCLEFILISTDNFHASYQAQQETKRTSQKADQEIENIKIQKQKRRKDTCEIILCVSIHFHSYLVLYLLSKILHF